MDKTLVPFWEETYQKDNVMTFSVEPNRAIKETPCAIPLPPTCWKMERT